MGFDLSGMNPNLTRPAPPLPKSFNSDGWSDKEQNMYADYEEWQQENSGVYFRNNVWWWRPLWNFVTGACDDILTEKDMESGSFNDGHKISKTKANKIAKKLYKLIKNGDVKLYEKSYKEYLDGLNDKDWDKSYPFSEKNVRQFANFCANSGGFRIC